MSNFKIIKIPPSVHAQLKVFCAKENKAMWWVAGIGIQNEIKRLKEIKSSNNKTK